MDLKATTTHKIVMITGIGEYPIMVYNYLLENNITIEHLIIEKPVSPKIFLKRRIKKLGLLNVLGQILNRLVVVPILKMTSSKRLQEIKQIGHLNTTLKRTNRISRVPSANSKECIDILQRIDPSLVVIIDTRILNKKTLSAISGKFLNLHAGITPNYRGWHGGYWALVNKDRENCGVTIHLVDEGIDTGGILYQDTIKPSGKDNYYTYPFLQLLYALPLLKKAITDVITNNIKIQKPAQTNNVNLYYHPTIWQYLFYRIKLKVK